MKKTIKRSTKKRNPKLKNLTIWEGIIDSDYVDLDDGIHYDPIFADSMTLTFTCSMKELSGFDLENFKILKKVIGVGFAKQVKEELLSNDTSYIYNTNAKVRSEEFNAIRSLGFKKVHSYLGAEGIVNVMILSE